MRRSSVCWSILQSTVVAAATMSSALAANLDVEKVGGACVIGTTVLGNATGGTWGFTVDPGDTDDVSATSSNSNFIDDGVASAEVIMSATANCNLATFAAGPLASVTASSQQIADANTLDASLSPADAGAPVMGHTPTPVNSTGLFEIQPDPSDPSVVSGVVNGIMDVISAETRSGAGTTATYNGFLLCGRYYIDYTGFNGVTNVEVGFFDTMGNPNQLVTYIGGAGVNYVVTTAELLPVSAQVPLQVEQETQATAAIFNPAIFACTSIVSQSGSSSFTVAGIGENDDPGEEYLAVGVDDLEIDRFGF